MLLPSVFAKSSQIPFMWTYEQVLCSKSSIFSTFSLVLWHFWFDVRYDSSYRKNTNMILQSFFLLCFKDLPMKFESEQRARTTRSPQWCWNRAPQYLAYHLTLLQPGRADYPHHWHPQGFSPSGITALIPDKNICKRQNAWYFFPPSSSVMKKSPFTPWNFLLTFLESP